MKKIKVFLKSIVDVKNFVDTLNLYDFEIELESGGQIVDAKSILSVLSVNISEPVDIIIHSEKSDIEEKLKDFIV